jgi:RNA polymerase sigma-70 factor (ECF subfamily)
MVMAYALRRVGPDHAQDVVAETFLAAWREFPRLPQDPAPWLYRAAYLRISNQRRSATRQVRVAARAAAQPLPAASDIALGVADAITVRNALDQLSDSDCEALLLTSWEGMSSTDAAAVVACSVSAFKVRLMRARRRLAAALRTGAAPPVHRRPREVTGAVKSDRQERWEVS